MSGGSHIFKPVVVAKLMLLASPCLAQVDSVYSQYGYQSANQAQARSPGKEKPRWYGEIKGQVSFIEDWVREVDVPNPPRTARSVIEFDTGIGFSGHVGYKVSSFIRLESELALRTHEYDSAVGEVVRNGEIVQVEDLSDNLEENETYAFDYFAAMANAYIDIPLADAIYVDPYIGGGVGWIYQTNGENDNSYAWQAMGGLSYTLDNGVDTFSLGYKYFVAPDVYNDTGHNFEAQSHMIEIGYRGYF